MFPCSCNRRRRPLAGRAPAPETPHNPPAQASQRSPLCRCAPYRPTAHSSFSLAKISPPAHPAAAPARASGAGGGCWHPGRGAVAGSTHFARPAIAYLMPREVHRVLSLHSSHPASPPTGGSPCVQRLHAWPAACTQPWPLCSGSRQRPTPAPHTLAPPASTHHPYRHAPRHKAGAPCVWFVLGVAMAPPMFCNFCIKRPRSCVPTCLLGLVQRRFCVYGFLGGVLLPLPSANDSLNTERSFRLVRSAEQNAAVAAGAHAAGSVPGVLEGMHQRRAAPPRSARHSMLCHHRGAAASHTVIQPLTGANDGSGEP